MHFDKSISGLAFFSVKPSLGYLLAGNLIPTLTQNDEPHGTPVAGFSLFVQTLHSQEGEGMLVHLIRLRSAHQHIFPDEHSHQDLLAAMGFLPLPFFIGEMRAFQNSTTEGVGNWSGKSWGC